jgi:alpha-L-rhamnosidase
MGHVAAPTAVRFEHRTDEGPVLGIGTATPRLSWIVPAADAAFVQEAYEVELGAEHRRRLALHRSQGGNDQHGDQ